MQNYCNNWNQVLKEQLAGINYFCLSFENSAVGTWYTVFSLTCRNKRLQHYNCWTNLFWSTSQKWYKNINNVRKIATGQGDYSTGCLLDYTYSKKYYKMIAIDLRKQQSLDSDPKAIQQISFTGHLDWDANTAMFYIVEEAKKTILEFSKGTVRVL